MSQLPEGATPFDHPDWIPRRSAWGCHGRDGIILMDDLVGKTVNVGTKDGLVYDGAVVAGFTPDGSLILRDGRKGLPWRGTEITEMDGSESVHCHDIARGYIHPEGGVTS